MSDLISEAVPVEIKSVGEMLDYVVEQQSSTRYLWFRGQRRAEWLVTPSLWREHDKESERNLTTRFRVRASLRRPDLPSEKDYAGWLSLMQHYKLPTRLLDWSRSPLVAAYFAVSKYISDEMEPSDAVIWVLNPHKFNEINGHGDLTMPIDAERMKKRIRPAFKGGVDPEGYVAVMAVEHDMRMFIQQGAFTIHSSTKPLNELQGSSRYMTPLLIRAENVRGFSRQTFAAGMRRGDIFPDLENLSAELTGEA